MKNIWMYWESKTGKIPKHIQLCIDSVKKYKGDIRLNLLDQNSIIEYLPDLRPEWHQLKHPAHKADYIRTRLVYMYGGLWLDCDMLVLSDLNPLFDNFPKQYDYACQNINTSIGCFMATPGCKLLKKVMDDQDKLLDNMTTYFQWNGIGNNLLELHGKDYKYFKWKEWTLDEIPGGKVSKLFSRNEEIEFNIDRNAIIFHLCNEDFYPLLKIRLRESRLLSSNMLISKLFRKSLGYNINRKSYIKLFDPIIDYNFLEYLKKNLKHYLNE